MDDHVTTHQAAEDARAAVAERPRDAVYRKRAVGLLVAGEVKPVHDGPTQPFWYVRRCDCQDREQERRAQGQRPGYEARTAGVRARRG